MPLYIYFLGYTTSYLWIGGVCLVRQSGDWRCSGLHVHRIYALSVSRCHRRNEHRVSVSDPIIENRRETWLLGHRSAWWAWYRGWTQSFHLTRPGRFGGTDGKRAKPLALRSNTTIMLLETFTTTFRLQRNFPVVPFNAALSVGLRIRCQHLCSRYLSQARRLT